MLASPHRCWLLGFALLAGCDEPPTLVVDDWTLVVDRRERPITLPAQPDLPDVPTTYRLEREVILPPALRDVPLELSIPYLGGRARLRVDGSDAVSLEGEPDRYRSRGPLRWRVPDAARADGRLALSLEVDHRWRGSGRLDVAPRLVEAGRLDRASLRARVFHLHLAIAALVALAQVGLTCVAIFLVDRRRRSYLWFGIQGLFAIYYPLYVGGLTASLGPMELPLLPTTLVGATHVGLLFTHAYFGLPPPSRLWWISGAGVPAVTWIVFLGYGPYLAVDLVAPILVAVLSLAIGYQLVVCARLARRGPDRRGAALLFLCWAAVALTAWPDFGAWLGFGEPLGGTHTATLGLTLFALFLSLLLGRGHMRSLAHADELNVALSAQVDVLEHRRAEIERLNEELLRQLDERSSQILATLAAAGSVEAPLGDLVEGDLLRDRYRVVGRLGRGGMGAVYEVRRLSDDARLAVKVAQEVRGLALARLAREAQIACRVRHPHVVRVHDVDVAEHGFVFVVMDLVEGKSLAELSTGKRPLDFWLDVLAQIADGIGALHAAGIVHRDLKPANVLVRVDEQRPHVTVVDFGISRMLDDRTELEEVTKVEVPRRAGHTPSGSLPSIVRALTHHRDEPVTEESPLTPSTGPSRRPPTPAITRPGGVPGTPAYLAPELLLPNAPITPAADVFSFGVLAYQLLTGVRPFIEPAAFALLEGRDVPTPPPLTDACPTLDASLAALLLRCVALDPEDRPTPEALVTALR